MNSTKFIPGVVTWLLIISVGVCFTFFLARYGPSLQAFSGDDVGESSISGRNTYLPELILQSQLVIPTLPKGRARYDNQRILRIYDFYFVGGHWESLLDIYDICFVTQTSLERMYWIPNILEKWTGPLSIAIRLISEEEWLIFNLYMSYLTKCHSTFKNQVAVHLAVPANLSALKIDDKILSQREGISLEAIWEKGQACPEAKQYLQYLLDTFPTTNFKKLAYKEVYPQNHMRNIARKGCGTDWTFSADVDTIPMDGMADLLQQFYNDQKMDNKLCAKCAYVIPTFELNYSFPFPETKKELVELFRSGAAQPFHINIFPPSQEATEYTYWASIKLEEEAVTISHEINQTKLELYEPYYVSPDNIEPFDERFVGYGFDRSSQFLAAITAGWNFSVLTPVYSIHWGLQTNLTLESPRKGGFGKPLRMEQIRKNRQVYISFAQELECKKKIGSI